MRRLLFVSVFMLFAALNASAQCQDCNAPCDDYYQCGPTWGPFLDCRNVGNCGGCAGWYCEAPLLAAAGESATVPLHHEYVLAAVTIERRIERPVELPSDIRLAAVLPAKQDGVR